VNGLTLLELGKIRLADVRGEAKRAQIVREARAGRAGQNGDPGATRPGVTAAWRRFFTTEPGTGPQSRTAGRPDPAQVTAQVR
jgi:hypothetical protein